MRARHSDYFRALANRMDAALRAGEPEEGPESVLAAESGNLRAAVGFGLESGDMQLVREISVALRMFWIIRGLYTEARSWLDQALALDDAPDLTRQRLLSALGTVAYAQGDYIAALAASDEAATLAMQLSGETERFEVLQARTDAAFANGDLEAAEALLGEALGVAAAADNGVGTSSGRRTSPTRRTRKAATTGPRNCWPRTFRSYGPRDRLGARGTRSPIWPIPRPGAAGSRTVRRTRC